MRIGYHEFADVKNHPYFAGIEWETLRESVVPFNPNRPRRLPSNLPPRKAAQAHLSNMKLSNSFSICTDNN